MQFDTKKIRFKIWNKHHSNTVKFNTKIILQWKRIIFLIFGSKTTEMGSDLQFNTNYLHQKHTYNAILVLNNDQGECWNICFFILTFSDHPCLLSSNPKKSISGTFILVIHQFYFSMRSFDLTKRKERWCLWDGNNLG